MWQKGGCVAKGGMHGRGACVAGEKANAADGTHPTGMHSCFTKYFNTGACSFQWTFSMRSYNNKPFKCHIPL